jgi:hypothetical protein
MTSCLDGTAFLIFHDPIKGRDFGYDVWEGEDADGCFNYTGQGVEGHQTLTRNNKGLLNAADSGLPIHFFVRPATILASRKRAPYTYVGQVTLGDPRFVVREAPDKNGNARNVFVFRLIPLGPTSLPKPSESDIRISLSDWTYPSTLSATSKVQPSRPTQIEFVEMKLHARFADYIRGESETIRTLRISVSGKKGFLTPDFYLVNRNMVVEAKPGSSREMVRLAIGQVLDYQNLLKPDYPQIRAGILLPTRPSADLVDLMRQLQISLVTESEGGRFEFLDAV